jgi:hypothetical protein
MSYVMRPINAETSEEAGSGNMMVNRLLQDLKLHGGSDETNEQMADVGGQVETQAVVGKPAAIPISSLSTTQRTPITPTTDRDNVLTNTHADADVSAEESFVDAGLTEDLLDGEDQHDGQAYDAESDVASETLTRATSRSERGGARSASVVSGPRTNKAALLRWVGGHPRNRNQGIDVFTGCRAGKESRRTTLSRRERLFRSTLRRRRDTNEKVFRW